MSSRARFASVCTVLVLVLIHVVVCTGLGFYTLTESGSPGWLAKQDGDAVRVQLVRPGAPAAEVLQAGDQILALDGRGIGSALDVSEFYQALPAGTRHTISYRSGGETRVFTTVAPPYGWSWSTFMVLTETLVSWIFLLSAVALFALKASDPHAQLLSVLFALLAMTFEPYYAFWKLPFWAIAGLCVVWFACYFFWAVFAHLFLVFPRPSPLLRRFPGLVRLVYIAHGAFAACYTALRTAVLLDSNASGLLSHLHGRSGIQQLATAEATALVSLGLLSLFLNYRAASESERRRLWVILVGAIGGTVPTVIAWLWYVPSAATLGLWARRIVFLVWVASLLVIPLSFGYAILRHQVIPIRVMVRRGLRYLLVSRALYVLEGILVACLLAFLLTGERAAFLDGIGGRADIVAALVGAGASIALLGSLNRHVVPALDRRFLREAYDAQKILSTIGQEARGVSRVEDLLTLVAGHVDSALHPQHIRFLLKEDGHDRTSGFVPVGDGVEEMTLPPPAVLRELSQSTQPHDRPDGGLWLPIVTKEELFGIVDVGPRRGDLPYSRGDKGFLGAVAWQVAYAVENNRLLRHMVHEEQLRREISIASDVQKRLFPESAPPTRRLDLHGLCLPAQGIGGDYYDFLPLGRDRIGLAVADVAGKGISAALLMSVIQASLRSQARRDAGDLSGLVSSMNKLLYRSTARNSFTP